MELFAAGFNAWNQLRFQRPQLDEPDDLHVFEPVLTKAGIRSVRAYLACTIVETSDGHVIAGDESSRPSAPTNLDIEQVVEASNGVAVVATRSGAILQTHPPPTAAGQVLLHAMPQAQLAAVATGFIALTSSAPSPEAVSTVYAWGDPRYPKLLGRSGDDSDGTTDVPRPVPGLSDLPTGPVVKIAAGNGYFAAALTKGGDLYAWGVGIAGRPARRKLGGPEEDDGADGGGGECALWAGLSEIPEPVVVVDPESGEEEQDVLDVGVGEAHAIVLCGSGDVYVVGDNDNGQLGLGKDIRYVSSWRKIRLPERRKAVAVAAGPRSSFIITQNEEPQEKH